ncbi:MAG: hypothetical protein HC900_02490 [Methylacidiphilales bacterium]|nr:hypothetical protein [Candidatus Methylacidiphilales bacterium]
MSKEAGSKALGAVVIDFAAHRAKRERRAGTASAAQTTPNVIWVPMMMMVLMPVQVGGADRTYA